MQSEKTSYSSTYFFYNFHNPTILHCSLNFNYCLPYMTKRKKKSILYVLLQMSL